MLWSVVFIASISPFHQPYNNLYILIDLEPIFFFEDPMGQRFYIWGVFPNASTNCSLGSGLLLCNLVKEQHIIAREVHIIPLNLF
jgi:hypothetical protein